ncbi:hypothetical protein HMPREF2533_03297 [Bacteroides fragilis]|nr:hypothetical protein HMPREF2530_03297 [Bacteroides fragilis]KXU43271.1 hypothetical protein HMPREF2533_03297 [Bacteroides fragilis]
MSSAFPLPIFSSCYSSCSLKTTTCFLACLRYLCTSFRNRKFKRKMPDSFIRSICLLYFYPYLYGPKQ